jgi:hypothetical protein
VKRKGKVVKVLVGGAWSRVVQLSHALVIKRVQLSALTPIVTTVESVCLHPAGTAIAFTREGKLSSSFLVGSEGGGLYRCLLHNKGLRTRMPGASDVKTEMRWSDEALSAMSRIAQVCGVSVDLPCSRA